MLSGEALLIWGRRRLYQNRTIAVRYRTLGSFEVLVNGSETAKR